MESHKYMRKYWLPFLFTFVLALAFYLFFEPSGFKEVSIFFIAVILFFIILSIPLYGLVMIALTAPFNMVEKALGIPFGISFDMFFGFASFVGFILLVLSKKIRALKKTSLDLPILIIVFSFILGIIFSLFRDSCCAYDPYLLFYYTLGGFFIYFLSVNVIRKKKDFEILIVSFILGVFLVSVISLFYYFSGRLIPSLKAGIFSKGGAILALVGFSSNQNVFATLFVLLVPFVFALIFSKKKIGYRLFYSLLFILFVLCAFLTFSRSAYIGIFVGILSSFFFIKKKMKISLKKSFFLFFSFLLLIFLLFFTFVFSEYSISKPTLVFFRGQLKLRGLLYFNYVKTIFDHPFGVGFSNKVYNAFDGFPFFLGTHNFILYFAFLGGFLGIFGIIFLVYRQLSSIFSAVRLFKKGHFFLAVGFFGSVTAFWIHSLFHDVHRWILVWFFFALAESFVKLNNKSEHI